jgi:hypothetical protein
MHVRVQLLLIVGLILGICLTGYVKEQEFESESS